MKSIYAQYLDDCYYGQKIVRECASKKRDSWAEMSIDDRLEEKRSKLNKKQKKWDDWTW